MLCVCHFAVILCNSLLERRKWLQVQTAAVVCHFDHYSDCEIMYVTVPHKVRGTRGETISKESEREYKNFPVMKMSLKVSCWLEVKVFVLWSISVLCLLITWFGVSCHLNTSSDLVCPKLFEMMLNKTKVDSLATRPTPALVKIFLKQSRMLLHQP